MKINFILFICLVLQLQFRFLYGTFDEIEAHPDKWTMYHDKEPTTDEANDGFSNSRLESELQKHDSLLSELQKITGDLEKSLNKKSQLHGGERKNKNSVPNPTTNTINSDFNQLMPEEDADKLKHEESILNVNNFDETPSNETNVEDDMTENKDGMDAPMIDGSKLENLNKNESFETLRYYDFFVGSNLFGQYPKQSFSIEDIVLLTIRKDFEALVPTTNPNQFLDDNEVRKLLKYFFTINNVLIGLPLQADAKHLAKLAFYDMLGGYLHYSFLPLIKLSYYAGLLNQTTVDLTIKLYEQSKIFLNTNGNGWRQSKIIIDNLLLHGNITPLIISDDFVDSACCALLDLNESLSTATDTRDSRMITSLPKLNVDFNGFLESIKLPYRSRNSFSIKSSMPVAILPRFYQNVIGCYKFQNISPDFFDHKFKDWIVENVYIHLQDRPFYPILGSVLKIMKTENSSPNKKIDKSSEHKSEDPIVNEVIKAYKSKPNKDNSEANNAKTKSRKLLDMIRSSKTNIKKSSSSELANKIGQPQTEEQNVVPYIAPSNHLEYYFPRSQIRLKNLKKFNDMDLIEKAYLSAKFNSIYLIFGFAFVMGLFGLSFLLVRQYMMKQPDNDDEKAYKDAKNMKSNRKKCDLQSKSSPTVCQPGRKIIPLPYSNLGGRMANCDLSYYRSPCDQEKNDENKQKHKTKSDQLENSSWTTAYLFHK